MTKEAKDLHKDDELGMVVYLENKARECVNVATRLNDEIIRRLNLLIARELVRVRERLLETTFGL